MVSHAVSDIQYVESAIILPFTILLRDDLLPAVHAHETCESIAVKQFRPTPSLKLWLVSPCCVVVLGRSNPQPVTCGEPSDEAGANAGGSSGGGSG